MIRMKGKLLYKAASLLAVLALMAGIGSVSLPTLSAEAPSPPPVTIPSAETTTTGERSETRRTDSGEEIVGPTENPTDAGESSETEYTAGSSTGRATTVHTQAPAKPSAGPTTQPFVPDPPTKGTVVGYYTGWSAAKGYTPDKIPASQLTHIHYAFAKIDPDTLKISLADPVTDRRNFAALRQLKKQYPHLRLMISVGGWDYSVYFSDAAATEQARSAFAESCVQFLKEYGFDGVDIDWEYPVSGGLTGNHNRPADRENFTLLLQTLRNRLDRQQAADGRTYLLSVAGAANTGYLGKIELNRVMPLLDYLFIMAYDFHGPWDRYADLNAPLYTPSAASPQYKSSVSEGMSAYLNAGAPAGKLVLGMPFYGYRYQGTNGLYSPFASASSITYDEVIGSYVSNPAYTVHQHEAKVPFLTGNGLFISYEDISSIAAKAQYARERGLKGVGAWSLSHDANGILLASMWNNWRN